jgi:protein gp37/ParB-like chromosome segregation protein Spo0J
MAKSAVSTKQPVSWRDVQSINVAEIEVPDKRLRQLQPEKVDQIAESMRDAGQLQPIGVRPNKGGHYVKIYRLVFGLHRFEAVKKNGWPTILATIVDMDTDAATLAEIDENLMRADLSPAERARASGRRKELYEQEHPETKPTNKGGPGRGKATRSKDRTESAPAFVDDTAAKTGMARSTVARDVTRANKVVVLAEIVGTSLDQGTEIDALAKLPPEEQQALAARAKAGEKVSARSEENRRRQVASGNGGDPAASADARKAEAAEVEQREPAASKTVTRVVKSGEYVTLERWNELSAEDRATVMLRAGKSSKAKIVKQTNTDIEWADWSWNPLSGCEHGCPYCYAKRIAEEIYPPEVGFKPTLWVEHVRVPINQKPPAGADQNVALKNIFTCSMADLFGRWQPPEWIDAVFQTVRDCPQWNFLFLTKFPKHMVEFEIPPNAWMGTTVDLQARVANAEAAFERLREGGFKGVCWLSCEPMLSRLKFKRLDLFDWIVIGGASPSRAIDGFPATPAWAPPMDWLADLHQQARAAGCKIFYKTNSGLTGQTRLREYPGCATPKVLLPEVFNYLKKPRDPGDIPAGIDRRIARPAP